MAAAFGLAPRLSSSVTMSDSIALHRRHEGGEPAHARAVGIGFLVEEEAHERDVAVAGRDPKGGLHAAAARVRVGALVEERLDRGRVAAGGRVEKGLLRLGERGPRWNGCQKDDDERHRYKAAAGDDHARTPMRGMIAGWHPLGNLCGARRRSARLFSQGRARGSALVIDLPGLEYDSRVMCPRWR